MPAQSVIDRLLASDEPAIRYKVRVGVLGEDPDSRAVKRLRKELQRSPRVQMLLSERQADGTLPHGAYSKWRGAHWVLTMLADLGCPPGDKSLRPMIDQARSWALDLPMRVIEGRPRRCASQEGNALLYLIRLGFVDGRCDVLANKLLTYQWEDGGWNCDKRPEACHASFHESLIPMRALNAYAQLTGSRKAKTAVKRVAEMFLERRLFRRKTNGNIIRPRFAKTHYPYFWQYTYLHGLKAMIEAGLIGDPRCKDALDLLESKRLLDGGFPAECKLYSVRTSDEQRNKSGQTLVDWGPTCNTRRGRSNDFVTAEALTILAASGRL
jgi:hypothetical protein